MVDATIVRSLVQDARDLIRVGGFGLYEFIWTLNRSHPEMPRSKKIFHARAAVEVLIREAGATIAMFDWPPTHVLSTIDFADVADTHFDSPAERLPYAALIATTTTCKLSPRHSLTPDTNAVPDQRPTPKHPDTVQKCPPMD